MDFCIRTVLQSQAGPSTFLGDNSVRAHTLLGPRDPVQLQMGPWQLGNAV